MKLDNNKETINLLFFSGANNLKKAKRIRTLNTSSPIAVKGKSKSNK